MLSLQVFANSFRIEKKKYTLHPGTTDYMERLYSRQCPSNVYANKDFTFTGSSTNKKSVETGPLVPTTTHLYMEILRGNRTVRIRRDRI